MVFSADVLPPDDPEAPPDEGEQWHDTTSGISYTRTGDGLWVEGGSAPWVFPSTPAVNDIFALGDRRWRWNGTGWQVTPAPGETESRLSTLESSTSPVAAALTAETSARTAADTTLQNNINTNSAAISSNTTAIATNTTAIATLTAPVPVVITDAASTTFDAASGVTNRARLTATGNRTLTAPLNPVDGQQVIIEHLASGAVRTLTLTTGSAGAFRFGSALSVLAATASGKTDYIIALYNGPAQRWDIVNVSPGF